MTGLKISPGLILPLEAVTQTFGILAVRGAGKSNTAAVMAEEFYRAHLPFVVVDPVGSWWGLRSSSDGKSEGLAVPIFGGRHGDVPLEKTAGQLIADLVVDQRLSCVLDVSEFSEGDKIRFLIDFAERLYRRNEDPLHLILEEADDYAPQRPFREQARLLRAWENVVRRGRARGLGITMVTQRSAALNKNVLTQIETLIVLRTTSPQDRKAIEGWVDYHGQSKELVSSLPGLVAGEAWVWSPSWLHILQRVKIRRRSTFDSAATPKDVKGKRPPATLADVDLGILTERMAETIERAKAEDPRELRQRIASLEKELRARPIEARVEPKIETVIERVEVQVPVFANGQVMKLEQLVASLSTIGETLLSVGNGISEALGRAVAEPILVGPTLAAQVLKRLEANKAPRQPQLSPVKRVTPSGPPRTITDSDPSKSQQRVLDAVAWLEAIGLEGERVRVGFLAGYRRGGRFNDVVSSCRTAGWIDYPRDGIVEFTPAGRALAAPTNIPANTDSLQTAVMERLNGSQRRVLTPLIAAYPNALSREALREASGYGEGGRFNDVVSSVRSLGLIDYLSPGWVVALPVLFLETNA